MTNLYQVGKIHNRQQFSDVSSYMHLESAELVAAWMVGSVIFDDLKTKKSIKTKHFMLY